MLEDNIKRIEHIKKQKIELFNDHFQNYKVYGIPKAQLVVADIPYNLGNNAYASNPQWYIDGITRKAKANLQTKNFSIQIKTLELRSLCTFAVKC